MSFARDDCCYIHFTFAAIFRLAIFSVYADRRRGRSWEAKKACRLQSEFDSKFVRCFLISH